MTVQQNLISDIETAISHGTPQRRGEALRHVTNLFLVNAADYSDEQLALFDDILLRLAAEIESSARALLSRQLAPLAKGPPKVIRALAFDDEIDVAHPVLAHSEVLDDDSLVCNAMTKSAGHLLAISQRTSLAARVTDVLVERGDETVVLSTVGNAGAKFSDAGFAILVRRSSDNDRIAAGVGARTEIPRHHFLKLLAHASDAVRAKLEAANPQAVTEIKRVVDEVAIRIQNRAIADSHDYSDARSLIEVLQRDHKLDERRIETLAQAGKFEAVVVALATTANMPLDYVERAMLQERSELLLIVCRAIGLSWPATKAILLLRARNHETSAQDIEQSLASFDRLKLATAQQVIRFHQPHAKLGKS